MEWNPVPDRIGATTQIQPSALGRQLIGLRRDRHDIPFQDIEASETGFSGHRPKLKKKHDLRVIAANTGSQVLS